MTPLNPPIKLLYLPNEVTVGDQVGPRLAFQAMLARGELSAYESVSFLVAAQERGHEAALAEIEAAVKQQQPDVLLWQHIGTFSVTDAYLARLRAVCPGMRLVYHEGDMFGGWAKPITASMACLIRHADACALVSTGSFAAQVAGLGGKAVLYSPPSVDTQRFGTPWQATAHRDFDVVLIGNRVRSLLPWKTMPGARTRAKLVQALTQKLGPRFGVFGAGWSSSSTSNQGPISYAQQEATVRRSRLLVSWDHYDQEASYFSDRLPISLLSGVPHVTNYQPGYEAVFGPNPPLFWAKTVPEMMALVEDLLARPAQELDDVGRAAADYGRQYFHAEVIYRKLLIDIVGTEFGEFAA